jgi:glyoxylase-like metal-dependent hydrolase (beta-lactamase superfamily II)
MGAGDLALAQKKVPTEALAGRVFTAVMGYPAVTPSDPITGATTFDVGQGADAKKVKAFPIPGHTPGSYAFLYDGVLFVGDAMIFKQGRLDPAIKLFDAHPDENKASIRQLQKLVENEEIDIVCTGHGGCTPKGLGRNQLTDLVARL